MLATTSARSSPDNRSGFFLDDDGEYTFTIIDADTRRWSAEEKRLNYRETGDLGMT